MSYPDDPPRRLNAHPASRDYHPSWRRVGVRIDGVERGDLRQYDAKRGFAETVLGGMLQGEIEPFWRWQESRQERRARERWDAKHGVPE